MLSFVSSVTVTSGRTWFSKNSKISSIANLVQSDVSICPTTLQIRVSKIQTLKGGKKSWSKYSVTMITQRLHLTQCIHQLVLHVSFQIHLLLKTALQICAINTRMGMIPIMSCSHQHNAGNGSPTVNLEQTQAISCTEHHAGFMWDNCFEEVCFQMDSEHSSLFCINTRYLVLCLHRKSG